MTQSRIYLDYAATSPLRPEALAAMLPYLEGPSFNPSSLHREGRHARAALEEARERIARVLGANRTEIVFVSGGSEANALAIEGLAEGRAPRRHVVSSAIEHRAVLGALESLTARGFEVTLLPVDRHGFVDPEAFAAALREETAHVSVMYANNEIGTIQAIERMVASARARAIPFHTDAVAAAGWLPLDVRQLGVDALSIAGHKFGGPKGFGVLCLREGTPIVPAVRGAAQERGRRAGTEDVAAAVGTAAALELAAAELRLVGRTRELRDMLEAGLLASVPSSRVNGAEPRLPNIANLSFSGVRADVLAARLDLDGIAVSPGSACTSGVAGPSHVVEALHGGDPHEALRISLGHSTSEEEVRRVLQVMPSAISEQRAS